MDEIVFVVLKGSQGKEIYMMYAKAAEQLLDDWEKGKELLTFERLDEKDTDELILTSKKAVTIAHLEIRGSVAH